MQHHVFDFCATSQDGHRVAVSVASDPRHEKRLSNILERVRAAGFVGVDEKGKRRRLADFARTWSECQASSRSLEVAHAILASRRSYDEHDVEKLLRLVARMPRSVRFSKLLVGCEDVQTRRTSIWHLIDRQVLKFLPTELGDLDNVTLVRV